jgi:hypothetical protein
MSQVAPRSSNSAPEHGLARHRSPAQVKLETLQKEHDRLLREIARKRASRDATERLARDAASALESRAAPLRAALASTLTELQSLFGALLGAESRLKKRDKARVRRVYLQLFPELGAHSDVFGDDAGANADDPETGRHEGAPRSGRSPGERSRRDPMAGDAGYSAVKPGGNGAGTLRALFRRLAVALHPDKVRDDSQCAALTAVMKEVTCAYESGDLARLLELERTWLASVPCAERDADEDLARRTADLLRANTELRRQLRGLSAELKDLKQTIPGAGDRRGARGPIDFGVVADQIVEELRAELTRLEALREFAASFLRGDLTIEEFLMGPPLGDDGADFFDRLVAEVLGGMADMEDCERSSRRRRRSRA